MRRSLSLAGLFLTASVAAASNNPGYSMAVLIDGAPAVEYAARGRLYVEALRGREFTIRLHNPGPGRVAVALSVDGRNVLDAKRTSTAEASKWVIGPGETLDVPGWQISGQTSRRFFFTETERSYAKWLGDTSNVGTIEAVFFREKGSRVAVRPAPPVEDESNWTPDRSSADGVEGGVPGGVVGGVPGDAADGVGDSPAIQNEVRVAPRSAKPSQPAPAPKPAPKAAPSEADRFAATGIGERTGFSVEWVSLELEDRPASSVALRYEFREQLVRLGVVPRDVRGLYAREHARGFEPAYAPDPDGQR
ncbi:MAG TPA: hypothetical protein VH854_04200 [Thermoanaerobaculia bacterium]|jgi:hypothetical protein|nr:hypothetical protein [Thermoanaerobaculia bacterium]